MDISISVTNDVYTDQRVNRTVRTLVRAGHRVRVIGRKRSAGTPEMDFPCRVRRMRLIFNKGPMFYAAYNIRLFFLLLFSRVGIILACDLDTLPACFLVSRLRKKILVFDSHEYFTEVPELVGRPGTRKVWERIEKMIMPHIHNAYTVSQSIAGAYQEKYGIRMEVIRNYPYKIKSLTGPCFSLKKGQESVILYQGSVNMGRGLELVILAMKFVENARLVIIGDGDILHDLMRLSENTGLSSRITFCGRVSVRNLYLYTIQADLGISLEEDLGLNYRYALPNKLFDYIQAQVPVLVSDLPEMAAVVRKYDIGRTIRTTDPRELASCFSAMLGDTSERKRWKDNLLIAAEQLCWEKEEARLLQVFQRFG